MDLLKALMLKLASLISQCRARCKEGPHLVYARLVHSSGISCKDQSGLALQYSVRRIPALGNCNHKHPSTAGQWNRAHLLPDNPRLYTIAQQTLEPLHLSI